MTAQAKDRVNNPASSNGNDTVVDLRLKSLYYGTFRAVRDTNLNIKRDTVTAFIGCSRTGIMIFQEKHMNRRRNGA